MRVERVRYFLAAVETGSMRAAAARCHISQPALGQQIALLEEDLNVVLLTRSRSGVRPTPAGESLLEPLRHLVSAEDSLHGAATEFSGAHRGSVSIGAISVTAETLVAPVVGRLRERHPQLRFTLTESTSTEIEAGVLKGALDFGVITIPDGTGPVGLARSILVSTPIGVVVRNDHPLAEHESVRWRDLENSPVVTMRRGAVLWDRLQTGLPQADVVVQAMTARSVRVMVAHGAGIGVLAPSDTSSDIPGLRWIPLQDAEPLRIGLVQRRDAQPSPSALVVRRLISERAAELHVSAGGGQMSIDAAPMRR